MLRVALVLVCVLLRLAAAVAAPAAESPAPPSPHIQVYTKLTFLDIPTIDERDHSFQVVGILEMQWKDPREKPGTWLEQTAVTKFAAMWHPDLEIDNEREPRKPENQVLIVKPDGTVVWQERFDARLSTRFDLHRLPFDAQSLDIVLQTFALDSNETIELLPSAGSGVSPALGLAEWSIGDLRERTNNITRAASDRYSELVYSLEIQRRPSFYFYAIGVPSILVVLVSFTTLWYDPKQFNAIVGPGVSCMLVLIALNFTVSSYLPRVSYVTTLNRFSLQCYVFVFAAIVLNAYLHTLGDTERSHRLRLLARLLLPLSFLVSNLVIYFGAA